MTIAFTVAQQQTTIQEYGADVNPVWGPKPLALNAYLFDAGVDDQGRVLVLQTGSGTFGSDTLVGQWFDRDGTSLTGPFLIASGVVRGENTSFQTAALHGGGLAIRMTSYSLGLGAFTVFADDWIAVVPSGSTEAQAAPGWLQSRPHTDLVRTARGYALVPRDFGATVQPCVQHVEVVSAAGESCGRLDLPIDSGSCETGFIRVGLDGTLLQMLPSDRETAPDPNNPALRTCTVRFWPAALR